MSDTNTEPQNPSQEEIQSKKIDDALKKDFGKVIKASDPIVVENELFDDCYALRNSILEHMTNIISNFKDKIVKAYELCSQSCESADSSLFASAVFSPHNLFVAKALCQAIEDNPAVLGSPNLNWLNTKAFERTSLITAYNTLVGNGEISDTPFEEAESEELARAILLLARRNALNKIAEREPLEDDSLTGPCSAEEYLVLENILKFMQGLTRSVSFNFMAMMSHLVFGNSKDLYADYVDDFTKDDPEFTGLVSITSMMDLFKLTITLVEYRHNLHHGLELELFISPMEIACLESGNPRIHNKYVRQEIHYSGLAITRVYLPQLKAEYKDPIPVMGSVHETLVHSDYQTKAQETLTVMFKKFTVMAVRFSRATAESYGQRPKKAKPQDERSYGSRLKSFFSKILNKTPDH